MENYVTPETAKKMKEAGFPQPDFKFGQLWYETERQDFAIVGTGKFELFKQHREGELIFAPTATDILRELGDDYALHTEKGSFKCICTDIFRGGVTDGDFDGSHENPAEACYLAWKELKGK